MIRDAEKNPALLSHTTLPQQLPFSATTSDKSLKIKKCQKWDLINLISII